jgi:hypothetical protein
MTRLHIPRIAADPYPAEGAGPGYSFASVYKGSEYQGMEASFFCPQCRRFRGIKNHSINAFGEVNASILCNGKRHDKATDQIVDCTFHEFVHFDDWDPAYMKEAGDEYLTKREIIR